MVSQHFCPDPTVPPATTHAADPPQPTGAVPDILHTCCTKVGLLTREGIYWMRVVRTARRPQLRGVDPSLPQWPPALVQ